jgi:hypothetical protein
MRRLRLVLNDLNPYNQRSILSRCAGSTYADVVQLHIGEFDLDVVNMSGKVRDWILEEKALLFESILPRRLTSSDSVIQVTLIAGNGITFWPMMGRDNLDAQRRRSFF